MSKNFWQKINDYLLAVGAQRDCDQICQVALTELGRLISFDTAYFVGISPQGRVELCETINVPPKTLNEYLHYYLPIDPCRKLTNPAARTMSTDWNQSQIQNNEFYTDYARPNDVNYSAGLQLHKDNGQLVGALLLSRSRCSKGFTEEEMYCLETIQPHLNNMYNLAIRSLPDQISSLPNDFDNLSPREAEIVALICQGLNTKEISSLLYISPLTVDRHIKNIFKKLQVSSRTKLIAKALGR